MLYGIKVPIGRIYAQFQVQANKMQKGTVLVLLFFLGGAIAAPTTTTIEAETTEPTKSDPTKLSEAEKYQNEHAKYQFATKIDDKINDLTNERNEVRNGLAVEGSYSYSDGYTKRTVFYIADEKGYRVTKMLEEPLDGPHIDPKGTASVSTMAHGKQISYKVQSVPVEGPVQKIVGESPADSAPLPQNAA